MYKTYIVRNFYKIVSAIEYFSGLDLHVLPHKLFKSENIVKKDIWLENKA